ncbi:MORC family CW-type Zinc finger protein [Plakobranchus ocellatus]|uniref:MORC family CW-type Zinc finger protein n=1 Tax=Plakobranchus ocellatus TaxID=259542 RepID=A0AAV4DDW7_9GAST|nr:MORC family CW-type Zinc finger protein [Plakobranchus ocellatus]
MAQAKKGMEVQGLPAFLTDNSANYQWVLAAFAEIIDNACNAKASEIWIDTADMEKTTCLSFLDNGPGMEAVMLYNMLRYPPHMETSPAVNSYHGDYRR